MERLSKKLAFVVLMAFVGQTVAAPRVVYVPSTVFFTHSLKDNLNKALQCVVSKRPSLYQVLVGTAVIAGAGYCLSKFVQWMAPLNEYYLSAPHERFLVKPKNIDHAMALFNKTQQKTGKMIPGAIQEDLAIVEQCLDNNRFKARMLEHDDLEALSRVGIIDVSEVEQLNDADKKAIKALQEEARKRFRRLIEPKIIYQDPTTKKKPKFPTRKQIEKKLSKLGVCHGRIRGILDSRFTQLKTKHKPNIVDVKPVIKDIYKDLRNEFNSGEKVEPVQRVANAVVDGQNAEVRIAWCDSTMLGMLESAIDSYNEMLNNPDDKNYFDLGLFQGYVLGVVEALASDHGADLNSQPQAEVQEQPVENE